jgi:hypothetical protein
LLAFITSLRHPNNSADYGRVEALLQESLRSVCRQTSDDYAVFVVGNRRPRFTLPPQVEFIEVDFPPPVSTPGPRFGREPFVWDKGTKIGVGLIAARTLAPAHVMIFDADDYVHQDLAAYVAARGGASGWYVEEGYIYSRMRQCYRVQAEFAFKCGTCHVLSWPIYEVPTELHVGVSQVEVGEAFGERLPALLGAHYGTRSWLRDRGVILQPLPFRAAVYQVDTGENHSGSQLRGLARPIGGPLVRDFGVPPLTGRRARLISSLAPAEAAYDVRTYSRKAHHRLRGLFGGT